MAPSASPAYPPVDMHGSLHEYGDHMLNAPPGILSAPDRDNSFTPRTPSSFGGMGGSMSTSPSSSLGYSPFSGGLGSGSESVGPTGKTIGGDRVSIFEPSFSMAAGNTDSIFSASHDDSLHGEDEDWESALKAAASTFDLHDEVYEY